MITRNGLFSFLLVACLLMNSSAALAHLIDFTVNLTGSTNATGSGLITLDLDEVKMIVQVSFTGLSTGSTGAHVHAATATPFNGTAPIATQLPTLPGFPFGVTAGSYNQTIDLTSANAYNPDFIVTSGGTVADALNALIFAAEDGKAYFSISNADAPNGEITGFLTPVQAVPEPSAILMIAGPLALGWYARRRLVASNNRISSNLC